MALTTILSLENGAFSYNSKPVFRNLNLEIFKEEVLCILGPNGCGKTTLLHCLRGFLPLCEGEVKLNSKDRSTMSERKIARKIGFVFQSHETPFPYTVLDVVLMGRAPHIGAFSSPSPLDTDIAEKSLTQIGIYHLKDQAFTQISGGERQLVLIARALSQEPEILLMDEPTSHLDFKNQALILQTLNRLAKQGLAIVMTSHFPDHALLFSQKAALMKMGTILAVGTPSQIVTDKNLGDLYDMPVSVVKTSDPNTGKPLNLAIPRIV